jgi:hypothetical protein
MEDKMKTLRFLILIVFVLSLFLSAAPTQAAGESLVYVALVTRPNSQAPLAIQAQREFRRLAPGLLAAQQSGQLIDFNTELRAGILMLRLAGRADEAADAASRMFGRPVYRNVHDALRTVPRQLPNRQGAGGAISAQFWVNVYESCFSGDVPINAHVIAILRDELNVVQAKAQLNEQDDGSADGFFFECFDWSNYNEVAPGYKVTFKVFDTAGGTLLGAFTSIAPAISFTSLNKTTAQIGGTGPANKAFDLYWGQPKLNAAGQYSSNSVPGTISAAKTWSGDVSAGKIRGGAYIDVTVYQTANIAFTLSMTAPHIYCQLGGNYCEITGFPFQALTLQITKGATTYTFSGRGNSGGWFYAELITPAGLPIKIKAGDKVQGTSVPLYTQPALLLNASDFTNDIVSGKAPLNRFFDVWVDTYSSSWNFYWAGSNAAGNFSVDTTADVDLLSTETSTTEIYYIDFVTGNTTDFARPYAP